MESDRKIEKLLRAFAKKRREQAGSDPFALHPVNRHLLQDEVKRQFGSTSEKRSGFLGLFGVRRSFVLAACGIALLCLLAALIVPSFSRARFRAQLASKQSEAKQRETFSEAGDQPVSETRPVAAAAPMTPQAPAPVAASNSELAKSSVRTKSVSDHDNDGYSRRLIEVDQTHLADEQKGDHALSVNGNAPAEFSKQLAAATELEKVDSRKATKGFKSPAESNAQVTGEIALAVNEPIGGVSGAGSGQDVAYNALFRDRLRIDSSGAAKAQDAEATDKLNFAAKEKFARVASNSWSFAMDEFAARSTNRNDFFKLGNVRGHSIAFQAGQASNSIELPDLIFELYLLPLTDLPLAEPTTRSTAKPASVPASSAPTQNK